MQVKRCILKKLVLLLLLGLVSACNQQEFYEKEFLEGAGIPDDVLDGPINPDIVNNDGGDQTGGTIDPGSGPGDGTTGGGGDGSGGDGTTGGGDGSGGDGTTGGGDGSGGDGSGGTTGGGDGSGGDGSGLCGAGTLQDASDTFNQNSAQSAPVDILWVVDDSGSMGDEQDALAYNFDVFIQDFIARSTDFTMAITTTDGRSGRAGNSVGDMSLLTASAALSDETAFMDNFRDWIRVGTSGSGTEMGLYTSDQFLRRHTSFVRSDAYLILVYVSDEEDQSSGNVDQYVNYFKSLKSNPAMVKAYSIVTKELIPGKQWETLGGRYVLASDQTNAESSDIHQDFYTTLSNMGAQILDLLDSFPLSGVPATADIQVTVDGVEITSGWTYDANAHVIRFDQNTVPAAGSVTIAYYQQCVGGN